MRNLNLTKIAILVVAATLLCASAFAQEKPRSPESNLSEESARSFDIKIPEGFKAEATDEPGILKWRKGDGEIYLAVGEIIFESGEKLLEALHKAAEKNKAFEEVKPLRLKGGRALLYKEKAPDDSSRLRSWHMLIVAKKKTIAIDFTAPAKDFASFVPAFEGAVKSFKLKPAQ
ncbi:MAG: hypothetical protein HY913_02805 [Desulfomonile tiedjei]|nr:hypothetical protein [Desulfomonile tiedjei]